MRPFPAPQTRRALVPLLTLVTLLAVMAGAPALATDAGEGARGPLDGMDFVGDFGPAGGPADSRDTLHFRDGRFWSGSCVPCGYPPGAYWVRVTGDGIHFRGELENPEGGRFVYVGVVRDGRIEAHINWRRERWYWTIDRDFRFEGRIADVQPAYANVAAAREAAFGGPDPRRDCQP
ncbi:hypothetical protein [Arhodomonas sp. AD133]|uniref:hypothetical protein n=1 Tax=Arhodomonas sp. AD133 TaxID=3415009 RepID=UPI003EBA3F66